MIIDCISDLHGCKPALHGGDLLIVAGDLTARDTPSQHLDFIEWLKNQPYKKKIVIAGNHDGFIQKLKSPYFHHIQTFVDGMEYLCDSACEFEGYKIWGSPWTPTFLDWHFMKDRGTPIREKWDLIPEDTDILITHGPPYGILDKVELSSKEDQFKHAGCEELRYAVERIQPRLHVFGHVHEGYGQITLKCTPSDVICVNASIMNEHYYPTNKPIRIEL